jgi:pyruvate dehydrogenase E1 component
MTPSQVAAVREAMKVREGREWKPFEGLGIPESELRGFLSAAPFV